MSEIMITTTVGNQWSFDIPDDVNRLSAIEQRIQDYLDTKHPVEWEIAKGHDPAWKPVDDCPVLTSRDYVITRDDVGKLPIQRDFILGANHRLKLTTSVRDSWSSGYWQEARFDPYKTPTKNLDEIATKASQRGLQAAFGYRPRKIREPNDVAPDTYRETIQITAWGIPKKEVSSEITDFEIALIFDANGILIEKR